MKAIINSKEEVWQRFYAARERKRNILARMEEKLNNEAYCDAVVAKINMVSHEPA